MSDERRRLVDGRTLAERERERERDTPPPCTYGDCTRSRYMHGLCKGHYLRQKRGLPMDTPMKQAQVGDCSARDCDRPKFSGNLCYTHYQRRRRGEKDWDRPVRYRRNGMRSFHRVKIPNRVADAINDFAAQHGMSRNEALQRLAEWGLYYRGELQRLSQTTSTGSEVNNHQ